MMLVLGIAHAPRPLGLGDPTWRRKSVVVYRDDVAMVSLVSWGDRLLGRIYDDVCKHTQEVSKPQEMIVGRSHLGPNVAT